METPHEREHEHAFWPVLPDHADESTLWLRWLVRLRWVAIFAQIITLSFSFSVLYRPWLALPLLAVVGLLVVSNLRAVSKLHNDHLIDALTLLAQLSIDVFALTAFFVLGGGPENPFTILYVIHVAMASVMLSVRHAIILTGVVLTCYALLHAYHLPLHLDSHALNKTTLITLGRVVSFMIAATSIAVFVTGLATTFRKRSRQLLEARDRTARTDRLRSVGTLAAGAAHELNTPLSTIGLRIRRIARRHIDTDTVRDLEVVFSQIERCRSVVEQLLVGAGDPSASGLEIQSAGGLVKEAVDLWSKGNSIGAHLEVRTNDAEIEVPRVAFTQALINLLENAREAQDEMNILEPLEVSVALERKRIIVRIIDQGCGLPDQTDRVGEPFFTTKNSGTGLGVFVARAVADGAGGGLEYFPREGGGTITRWWFPVANRRSNDRTSDIQPSTTPDRG